jgi:hypothetical protein
MKVVRGNLLRRSCFPISVTKRPMLRPRQTLGHAGLASLIHTSRLGHHGVLVCVCLLLQYLLQSCSRGEGGNNGGHVLRETTSRGLCELVCPSRTSERGGKEYCVKEGRGEEGKREEGACKGGATTLQPWIFRLIRNADALAATSPTLLFRPM